MEDFVDIYHIQCWRKGVLISKQQCIYSTPKSVRIDVFFLIGYNTQKIFRTVIQFQTHLLMRYLNHTRQLFQIENLNKL